MKLKDLIEKLNKINQDGDYDNLDVIIDLGEYGLHEPNSRYQNPDDPYLETIGKEMIVVMI